MDKKSFFTKHCQVVWIIYQELTVLELFCFPSFFYFLCFIKKCRIPCLPVIKLPQNMINLSYFFYFTAFSYLFFCWIYSIYSLPCFSFANQFSCSSSHWDKLVGQEPYVFFEKKRCSTNFFDVGGDVMVWALFFLFHSSWYLPSLPFYFSWSIEKFCLLVCNELFNVMWCNSVL